jgi:hypothetical protein
MGRRRVRRLMKKLGLWAVRPKRNTSKRHPGHKVYPYLLRGKTIDRANQVWAADITYIPMRQGFLYLVAIIDCQSGVRSQGTRRILPDSHLEIDHGSDRFDQGHAAPSAVAESREIAVAESREIMPGNSGCRDG